MGRGGYYPPVQHIQLTLINQREERRMGVMQTIELNLALVVSIIACILSAYSITQAKKRSDSTEIKEATTQITQVLTEMKTIREAMMGKPTMAETIAQHAIRLDSQEKRIDKIEQAHNE